MRNLILLSLTITLAGALFGCASLRPVSEDYTLQIALANTAGHTLGLLYAQEINDATKVDTMATSLLNIGQTLIQSEEITPEQMAVLQDLTLLDMSISLAIRSVLASKPVTDEHLTLIAEFSVSAAEGMLAYPTGENGS